VVADRTLRKGVDPVTTTMCLVDGLIVAGGVTLDLAGTALRGRGTGAGVRIPAGAAHVTVRNGTVVGFGTGVLAEETSGANLTHLQVVDNTWDGVRVTGNSNTLERSVIEGNRRHGALVMGDANRVANLLVERNGGDGMSLVGTGNTASRNMAASNLGTGLATQGAGAVVDRNRATGNGGAGLKLHGLGHTVTSNIARLNTGTGLQVVGTTDSRFDRNRGERNGGFGITDDSTGGGTAGTANTYTLNLCGWANIAGASWPAGLCR
jgi:hypothetical protein